MGFGDELLVTGHCRLLQQTDPRKVRLDYGKKIWNEVFDHNPRIAHSTDKDVQVYYPRPNNLRPYCAGKTTDRWTWQEYKPPVGELYFQPDELALAARHNIDVVIEPGIKSGASPNKQWGPGRWAQLIAMMLKAGIRPVQFVRPGTKQGFPGVSVIETNKFRRACAILARARAAVVHEGGLHHAAAVVGVPAVVIYGGFISPAQTGYDLHTNLFTGGEPCGWRIPCRHCARAMEKITPELVLHELQKVLARRTAVAA